MNRMWPFRLSNEERGFLHDVFLIIEGVENGFHTIQLNDTTTLPMKIEMRVKDGHCNWQGLCNLIFDKYKLSQECPNYAVAWVEIKEPCWTEERGDYYKVTRQFINDQSDQKVIASYIYDSEIDFHFTLTDKMRRGNLLNSLFSPTARLVIPDESMIFTRPTIDATNDLA
jgi:hypothetical protein